jgi:hypothetical protein
MVCYRSAADRHKRHWKPSSWEVCWYSEQAMLLMAGWAENQSGELAVQLLWPDAAS